MDRAEKSIVVEKVDKNSEYLGKKWEYAVLMEISALSHNIYKKIFWTPICQRWADVGIFYREKHGQLMC